LIAFTAFTISQMTNMITAMITANHNDNNIDGKTLIFNNTSFFNVLIFLRIITDRDGL
jgi:hypothetical protein